MDNTNEDDDWVNVGTLGFYLEIKRRTTGAAAATETDNDLVLKEFTSHSGKMFSVQPYFNDSYNPYQIRVMIPGRYGITSIWKYSGDAFLSKFLTLSTKRTRCKASLPSNVEALDDPKRKCWMLIPIDVHFYIHKEMNLLEEPGKNVKRQVKQLMHYMRGGTQPNPARYQWPIVREECAEDCERNADVMGRLMKKKTAKDWWK